MSTSLTLDFIRKKKIMMAYRMNGRALNELGSPFQLVAEKKWVINGSRELPRLSYQIVNNARVIGKTGVIPVTVTGNGIFSEAFRVLAIFMSGLKI